MSRARRLGTRILRTVGIVAGSLVVAVVVLVAILHTSPGEHAIQALLTSQVEDRIQGDISFEKLEFQLDGVELEGVVLRTPEGETVLTAERVVIDISLLSLLRGDTHIEHLLVVSPHARLWKRVDGEWSLPAALSSRHPRKREPTAIAIDAVRIHGGSLDVRIPTPAGPTSNVRLRELQISADDIEYDNGILSGDAIVRAFTSGPSRAALAIEARARAEDDRQSVQVDATLGEGTIKTVLRLPPRDSAASWLEAVAAHIQIDIPVFHLEKTTFGPIHLTADLEDGRLQMPRAHIQLPGLTMSSTDATESALAGTIDIAALGATLRAVEALVARDLPAIGGRGKVNFRVGDGKGSIGLAVNGYLTQLLIGELQAYDVRLQARLGDLTRPPRDAQVALKVGSLTSGDRHFADLVVDIASADRQLAIDAGLGQPEHGRSQLHLRGSLDQDYHILRTDRLRLSHPQATWTSDRPATLIRSADGGLQIENLGLKSGDQRIVLDLSWTPAVTKLAASISRVRLSSLPLPGSVRRRLHEMSLRGVVDAEIQAEGPLDALDGTAHVSFSRGRIADLKNLSGSIDARFSGGRAHGSFAADSPPAHIGGSFDIPMSVAAPPHARLTANVEMRSLRVARLWRAVRAAVPPGIADRVRAPSGMISASARLGGTRGRPTLRGRLALRDGEVEIEGAGRYELALALEGSEQRIRVRKLSARSEAGSLDVSGQAVRQGDDLRFDYLLNAKATSFLIPTEEPVRATFTANLRGIASKSGATCKLAVKGVRVVPHHPPREKPRLTRRAPKRLSSHAK